MPGILICSDSCGFTMIYTCHHTDYNIPGILSAAIILWCGQETIHRRDLVLTRSRCPCRRSTLGGAEFHGNDLEIGEIEACCTMSLGLLSLDSLDHWEYSWNALECEKWGCFKLWASLCLNLKDLGTPWHVEILMLTVLMTLRWDPPPEGP